MSEKSWNLIDIDLHLKSMGWHKHHAEDPTAAPSVTPALKAQLYERLRSSTLAATPTRRRPLRKTTLAAVALSIGIAVLPATLHAVQNLGETILGVRIQISDLSLTEWYRQGFNGWLASPGMPPLLSQEETADMAQFPIRTPSWLPTSFQATGPAQGALPFVHHGLMKGWQLSDNSKDLFVTQSFRSTGGDLAALTTFNILQRSRRGSTRQQSDQAELVLPPNTQQLTVAGYPAFYTPDQPLAKADAKNERRSILGQQPDITGYVNKLTVWVSEKDGVITEIILTGTLPQEHLVRIAASLFD